MENQFFLLFLFIIQLSGWHCTSSISETSEKPVNVILIMTDDQGYGDLACHGNPYIKTPHLDQLYKESVRLTNFHVGTTCSPTRAALMTGRYGNRVGVWHTIAGRSQLAAEEMTMGDVFTHNDYQTGMFGKWHLGDSYPFRPQDRGFKESLYHGGGGVWQMPDFWDNDYFDDTYFRNGQAEKKEGYCTDIWFDAALDFIHQNKDQPFFTYIATNAPHGPFHVDSSYIKPYLETLPENFHTRNKELANFYGMLTNFDENLGRLLNKLEEWDLKENTLLIFLTDNGTALGARFDADGQLISGYNSGMRGTKSSQYEGGHRVPCFLRLPSKNIQGGKDISTLTAHLDLLPTMVDILNLDLPEEVKFDGKSLSPLFNEKADASWVNRILITDTQRRETPIKWQRSAVMKENWRLINGKELFNLDSDPAQLNDIASANEDLVKELTLAYEGWWSALEPGFQNYTRAVLGPENGETVILYSHDWLQTEKKGGEPNLLKDGSYYSPWNQNHIRNGPLWNGIWEVHVNQPGNYQIELRRWPAESKLALRDGIPVKKAVDGGQDLPEGQALPIDKARLKIGDQVKEIKLRSDAQKASFEMNLSEGPTQIKTWLEGEGEFSLGAYYVYITRKN